jgi:hypothetical protein
VDRDAMLAMALLLVVVLVTGTALAQGVQDTTGFFADTPPTCSIPINSYQYQLVNGQSVVGEFTVDLSCTGCVTQSTPVQVGPQQVSPVLTITAPAGCTLSNRYCILTATVLDLSLPVPTYVQVGQFVDTCGVVQPDSYTSGCSYANWVCQVTNQECWHYAPCLLPIALVLFVLMGLLAAIYCIVRHQTRLAKGGHLLQAMSNETPYEGPVFGNEARHGFPSNGTVAPSAGRPQEFDLVRQPGQAVVATELLMESVQGGVAGPTMGPATPAQQARYRQQSRAGGSGSSSMYP